MFELPEATEATLRHLNVRPEMHGEEPVTAVDVNLELTLAASTLAMFHAGLLDACYLPVDERQDSIPGEAQPRTELRAPGVLKPLGLVAKLEGRNVQIEHGEIGIADFVRLEGTRVHRFTAEPMKGGSVKYSFQVQVPKIPPEIVGALSGWLGKPVRVVIEHSDAVEDTGGDVPPQSLTTETQKPKGRKGRKPTHEETREQQLEALGATT